jgi:hypothetical protein
MGRLSSVAVATISSGTSQSAALDLSDYAIAAIITPAAIDTAALTFLASDNQSGTYVPVYDDAGTEVSIASSNNIASRAIVDKAILEQLAGLRWLKIRSGTSGTPVNTTADRVYKVLLKS